ncbi:MAG: hypothetical protein CMN32_09605 [Saprospirales bacterium]|nr:hypothetical protein [Saprospirales bacterium]
MWFLLQIGECGAFRFSFLTNRFGILPMWEVYEGLTKMCGRIVTKVYRGLLTHSANFAALLS